MLRVIVRDEHLSPVLVEGQRGLYDTICTELLPVAL